MKRTMHAHSGFESKLSLRRLALALLCGGAMAWPAYATDGPRGAAGPTLARPIAVKAPRGADAEERLVVASEPAEPVRITLGRPVPVLGAPQRVVRDEGFGVAPASAWDTPLPLPQPPPPADAPKPSDQKPGAAPTEAPAAAEPPPASPTAQPSAPAPGEAVLPMPAPAGPGHVVEGDPTLFGWQGLDEAGAPIGADWDGEGYFVGGMGPYGATGRVWMRFEYLGWVLKADKVPPLVTSTDLGAVPPGSIPGALGVPGTVVLFGDVNMGFFSGGRGSLGWWWDSCERLGMDGSFFMLQQRNKNFFVGSNSAGNPPIFRPFYNTNAFDPALGAFVPTEDVQLVALPGILAGSVDVRASTRLLGADLNFRKHIWQGAGCRSNWSVDGLAGFRYLRLDESITITEDLVGLAGGPAPGARFFVQDRFSGINNFYGAQLGLLAEIRWRRLFMNSSLKFAFGATSQRVEIEGQTVVAAPPGLGGNQQLNGGLLARPSNIGNYNRNVFSIAPEFGVQLGLQVTDHMRVFVGYNLLVWTNVQRPGAAIPRAVNGTYLQRSVNGVPAPAIGAEQTFFRPSTTTFWAQGVTAGLEWRF
ncbi:MAG TPA: BBP7 family outer membrane beta-barrel protein [Gemmatales bacterium]|nr:BBP7 family outer membrane beta-barrel protein [Gemmatales bacterium]